jgi:hypothetical protein
MKDQKIDVHIPSNIKQQMSALAVSKGVSQGAIVRDALVNHLAQELTSRPENQNSSEL